MSDDAAATGFAICILFLALCCLMGLYSAVNSDNQKARIQTYQNQLNTYILCVQKASDKSVCGKQPDVKNYL